MGGQPVHRPGLVVRKIEVPNLAGVKYQMHSLLSVSCIVGVKCKMYMIILLLNIYGMFSIVLLVLNEAQCFRSQLCIFHQ